MGKLAFAIPAVILAALTVPAQTFAEDTAASLPSGAVGLTFHYTTTVKTPKGQQSSNGTIALRRAGSSRLDLTVTSSDGSSRTIPLIVANGSVRPAQTPAPGANSATQAAAQALLANMKLAATISVAARKTSAPRFKIPVTLTPVGQGTPVLAQVAMVAYVTRTGTSYAGDVEGSTTTRLPQNGGLDPQQLAKSVGVGIAEHAVGLTPVGRAATMVAMHHRNEEEKKAANGDLPDTITLTVRSRFANGHFQDIAGTQIDALKIGGKTVSIVSNWSFTAVPGTHP